MGYMKQIRHEINNEFVIKFPSTFATSDLTTPALKYMCIMPNIGGLTWSLETNSRPSYYR